MTVSAIKRELVLQAIRVLRDINKKYYEDSSKKKPLLEDEEKSTVFLQVTLKKIPNSRLIKMIKVNLPHTLVKDSEICLITGDLDKKDRKADIEPDVLHYKALLNKHGVTHISEVLTLRQLRTEYKPYEARLKLLAAYDIFLADNKIFECLPRVLGRHFFKKRKFPIQINLETPYLKEQIEKALSTKMFYITGHGNSCNSEVAYLDMADKEIIDNVMAVAKALSEKIPGTWDNVMGMYLKTSKSKAVPLYMSHDDPNSVQLQDEEEESDFQIGELTTTTANVNVKVYNDGRVETIHMKEVLETSVEETNQNITEKSNLNSNLPEPEFEDTVIGTEKKSKSGKGKYISDKVENNTDSIPGKRKKKKQKYLENEVSIEDFEDTVIGTEKIAKRGKGKYISDKVENNTDSSPGKREKRKQKCLENEVSIEGNKKKNRQRTK